MSTFMVVRFLLSRDPEKDTLDHATASVLGGFAIAAVAAKTVRLIFVSMATIFAFPSIG